MSEQLKWPAGEFTHGDFAEANGKTKPSVYNQLQAAIKDGTIVKTEKRSSGKGKPSQYYKVANATATVVIPATPAPVPTPAPVVVVDVVAKVEPVIEAAKVESVKPSETPVVINPEPVVVAEVTPVVESVTTKVEDTLPADTHSINNVCPVCKKNLMAWKDATGVMVQCMQPASVCSSAEHPFGHGKNEKDAYETLTAKWTFALKSGESR